MQFSDEELMQQAKEGNSRAFDVLVRKWEHRVFNLIYRIVGDFETAEDIRQEVFIRIYKSAKQYRPRGQFKTWLYRIAVNCSINEVRKRERRQTLPLSISHDDGEQQKLEDVIPDHNPGPDEVIQCNEIAEHIQGALLRLSNEQRAVIVMKHYEGLKFREIASVLDCPLGTVKSRMHQGLEQMRIMLRDFRREGVARHGM